jgi:hypothetical protein
MEIAHLHCTERSAAQVSGKEQEHLRNDGKKEIHAT